MCVCGGGGGLWGRQGGGCGFREPQRWLVSHRMVHLKIFFLSFWVFKNKNKIKAAQRYRMHFLRGMKQNTANDHKGHLTSELTSSFYTSAPF